MNPERADGRINDALIIEEPWLSKILRGEKTWELRTTHCRKRGWVGLIRKGSGLVVGVAKVTDSHGPLTDDELHAAHALHRVPADVLLPNSSYRFAWELRGVRALQRPVAYPHPNGAVKWVRLTLDVTNAIAAQIPGAPAPIVPSGAHAPVRPSRAAELKGGRDMTETVRDLQDGSRARSGSTTAVAAAEAWLGERFKRTRAPTKYIAGFDIGGGREIALERTHQAIQVWIGSVPDGLTGFRVRNRSNPGQPYAATQSRNSNLRSVTPTLADGHVAYHLELDDLATLQALV
jgi:hypothetical protein